MKRQLFILMIIIGPALAIAQSGLNGANSPFSRFGIGDINDPEFMHLRLMGNISASFADGYHLNIANPASYSYLAATSFEMGVESRFSSYDDGEVQESTSSGRLSYMGLGFPLRNPINNLLENEKRDWNIGMAFFMLPVSTVAYDLSLDESDPDIGDYRRVFRGQGGVYKVGFGSGVKYKNFSAGVNFGFNFGNILNQRITTFPDNIGAFNNNFSSEYNVRGADYTLGAIYQLVLNKEIVKDLTQGKSIKALNFGFTAKNKSNFNGEEEIFFRNELASPSRLSEAIVEFIRNHISKWIKICTRCELRYHSME